MNSYLLTLIQIVVVTISAPFVLGLVRTCKARLQGRIGASPLLPYISFATLLKKQMVISPVTSWVFRASPFVVLGSTLFLAAVLPLVSLGSAAAGLSDFVIIADVLALGAVFLVLGGLDPGSAFGGMGSSREMTISSLVEPAMIMTFATFTVVTGAPTIAGMVGAGVTAARLPFMILPLLALVLISLAENARYPVDNPATHLELTMVHEAMVLEYSGPYLAMLEYASSLKLAVFVLLIANIAVPFGLINATSSVVGVLAAIGAMLLKFIIGAVLLAVLESTIAKMRFYRMQEYMSVAFFIALAGLATVLIITRV